MFQFTHPGRGATLVMQDAVFRQCRFNSRTPGGVRPQLALLERLSQLSFNSRTPGGVRRRPPWYYIRKPIVSIHAPREGCDEIAALPSKSSRLFQFTHPGRGATGLLGRAPKGNPPFQFTHPGRGATFQLSVEACVEPVSIHAPREGCDLSGQREDLQPRYSFNSRTPGGVRH